MPYFLTPKLIFPLKNYRANSFKFREKCWYHKKYWGVHLGEDMNVKAGTQVLAGGRGKVVYSALHPGNKERPNWGNIIILAHKSPTPMSFPLSLSSPLSSPRKRESRGVRSSGIQQDSRFRGNDRKRNVFFSLYAHLGKRLVKKGDKVELGKIMGRVGKKNTKENGWWPDEHLHFAIYTGEWQGKVLPGYWQSNSKRTKLNDWQKPSEFVKKYVSN